MSDIQTFDKKDLGKKPGRRGMFSMVWKLLIALAISLFIITFVMRTYEVNGASMSSTLKNSDKLIVWKVPRTWSDLTRHQFVPARGSIIVFNEDVLTSCGQTEGNQLVKRVIALPGERVTIQKGQYVVYNAQHPDGFNPDKELGYFKGRNVPITTGDVDLKLRGNQIFVSGDNRPESCDSRAFGPIAASQVVGQVEFRMLPLSKAQKF